jgi:multidrug efflux pump
MQVIELAMLRSRTVVLSLLVILIGGIVAYATIPKEAEPDIEIPIVYVSIEHDGISPEDSERLLVRPMEQELRSIERRDRGAHGQRSQDVPFRPDARVKPGR